MWGSWFVAFFASIFVANKRYGISTPGSNVFIKIGQGLSETLDNLESVIATAPVHFIILFGIGFLIGWGIHSLIRRVKK